MATSGNGTANVVCRPRHRGCGLRLTRRSAHATFSNIWLNWWMWDRICVLLAVSQRQYLWVLQMYKEITRLICMLYNCKCLWWQCHTKYLFVMRARGVFARRTSSSTAGCSSRSVETNTKFPTKRNESIVNASAICRATASLVMAKVRRAETDRSEFRWCQDYWGGDRVVGGGMNELFKWGMRSAWKWKKATNVPVEWQDKFLLLRLKGCGDVQGEA